MALLVACSYGLAYAFRGGFDDKAIGDIFNWATQFRSFLFDPGIAVATAFSAWVLRRLYLAGGWFTSWWWALVAYGIGVAIGLGIRLTLDYTAYENAKALPLIYGLAKAIHDWWTWPVLAATLIYFGVPLVLAHRLTSVLWYAGTMVVALSVVVWLNIGNGHDDKLDVRLVSTATDYGTWRSVPALPPTSS